VTAGLTPEALRTRLVAEGLSPGEPVHLKLLKRERLVELWGADADGRYRFRRAFPALALSGGPGPKMAEGDRQVPEGLYRVGPKQLNPRSRFHLGINLGYPNALERQRGWTGSALMIHGGAQSAGCYAIGDPAIEIVYGMVAAAFDAGQAVVAVHALPCRLSGDETGLDAFSARLARAEALFVELGRPPRAGALLGQYVLEDEREFPQCDPIVAWP